MPIQVNHAFISPKTEQTDPTLVGPNEWNANHVVIDTTNQAYNNDYIFTPQTPNMPLTGGITNTITLTPVPKGVNGTNTKHCLLISGGSGTTEVVTITGGTAVSGAASGTITFVPANNHTGAWTIQSATGGIGEAAQDLHVRFNGGKVNIVTGQWTIYCSIPAFQNMWYYGAGYSTVLIPASTTTVVFDANVPIKVGTPTPSMMFDNIMFSNFMIDAQTVSTGVNSIYGMRFLNSPTSTETWSFLNIIFDRILFNNIGNAIYMHRAFQITVSNCTTTLNSQIYFVDSTLNNTYNTTSIAIINHRYYWPLLQSGIPVTYTPGNGMKCFTLQWTESVYFTDCMFLFYINTANALGIQTIGQCEDLLVSQCLFENPYIAIQFATGVIGSTTYYADSCRVQNSTFDSVWYCAIQTPVGDSTVDGHAVQQITISGNEFSNLQNSFSSATFINLQNYTKNIIITDNIFAQFNSGQSMIDVGTNTLQIVFGPNIFQTTGSAVGTAISVFTTGSVYGLEKQFYTNIATNLSDSNATIASAATLAITPGRKFVTVTGTVSITSMTYSGALPGDTVTLLFTGALTVTKGGNLKLNSNFVTTGTATDSLTLYWDGTNMIELSRSAN